MDIRGSLQKLSLALPEPPKPGGNYMPVNCVGNIAYVAIQLPKHNGEDLYIGRLGVELTTEQGYLAAQLVALNILSQVHHAVGFEKVLAINHYDGYYQAADEWMGAPRVFDGASDLFVNVLGEQGRHSRAIFGVERLPRNYAVGITATFTLRAN